MCVCIDVCMYVCMYVCTYARMYVRTYVCMYVCRPNSFCNITVYIRRSMYIIATIVAYAGLRVK